MAQTMEESLLRAIQKDDLKGFQAMTKEAQPSAYRLGRFPVLSLLYLYRSRRILAAYEESFLKLTVHEALREPVEVSKKFATAAGKCLRLYLSEIVSPLEMLLILDRTKRLKRVYSSTKPSAAVKERLQAIYTIKYALNVSFEGNEIKIDRRPLSYREKKKIAIVCLSSFLAVSIAVGAGVTALALKPAEGEVTKLSQIDFGSSKEYTLKRDIELPENFSVEKTSCHIVGNGHRLVLGKGVSLGELGGTLSGLTIESAGDAVFTSVSEGAVIENVTVNVNAAISATEGTAFIAEVNYGRINGVTLNVSGELRALAGGDDAADELSFGGIVQLNAYRSDQNYGTIQSCTVNYTQFRLMGEASANAVFGGVAGNNDSRLEGCTVTGVITADTFDIGGICANNSGLLFGNTNEAELSQTSADTGWNPIVSGIVVSNSYAVDRCKNTGKISSVSTCGSFEVDERYKHIASAAGIAYLNQSSASAPYLVNCTNTGDIESGAAYRDAYAAGICQSSSGAIESCKNAGAVTVRAEHGCDASAGGIAALAYADIYKSVNEGAVSAIADGTAFLGGISARSWARISVCVSSGEVNAAAPTAYAGGIFGLSNVIIENTLYGAYVYFAIAEHCVSSGKISAVGENSTFAGGIAGFVGEAVFNGGETPVYFGGRIADCYVTGECAPGASHIGAVVGACGANIYEKNSYTSGNAEYRNFEGNYYSNNFSSAFGATLRDENNYEAAADKGATAATPEEIHNSEGYQAILNALNS